MFLMNKLVSKILVFTCISVFVGCPLKKTTATAYTDDLLVFITAVKTLFHSVSLALGKGEFRSQHALSGCVPEMPTASPLHTAPLP